MANALQHHWCVVRPIFRGAPADREFVDERLQRARQLLYLENYLLKAIAALYIWILRANVTYAQFSPILGRVAIEFE
ncbi:hypothetical protein CVN56_30030 [Rhodococcus sp. AQ5-07]|nr:hypothetical protein CVN56_30030 [Rhodococcus sp. AQ5-07]